MFKNKPNFNFFIRTFFTEKDQYLIINNLKTIMLQTTKSFLFRFCTAVLVCTGLNLLTTFPASAQDGPGEGGGKSAVSFLMTRAL